MIVLLVVIYFMSSKFAGLAALFEAAGKCMYNIPQIVGPPILATIVLVLFLAFWLSVVMNLSTATVPGFKPLLNVAQMKNAPVSASQVSENSNGGVRNGIALQKTFKLVEYNEHHFLKYMLYFYLVALIWVSEFIFAASQVCS